ncbi:putative disease resistance protein RGA4 [Coffea arabica]|uniref:Disease resistance protein RGA4 n=1 Tax=Coffea arabica TaxID=13443 RepID=A0A6P6TT23_COFAR|nr:putative disease resistance protein RGA4 [Coffea arabica]
MADVLIASTIEVALKKTLSLANERIGKLFQFKEDLETLKGSVAMIQAVLADAEEKQTHDQAVRLWLQRLEAVAFDAENLFDELNYEALRRHLVGKDTMMKGDMLIELWMAEGLLQADVNNQMMMEELGMNLEIAI